MLNRASKLQDVNLHALDGHIGGIDDLLFDQESWDVRYLIIRTGGWLIGRHVLLAPAALDTLDLNHGELPVKLTKQQIKDSPSMDSGKPVTEEQHQAVSRHFGWPVVTGNYPLGGIGSFYVGGVPNQAGTLLAPPVVVPTPDETSDEVERDRRHRLGSTKTLTGFTIQAIDGDIGHVDDFLIDDTLWTIGYLVVATKHWLPGRKVLIAPISVTRIDWQNKRIHIDLTQEGLQTSPEYRHGAEKDEHYEHHLVDSVATTMSRSL